MRMMVIKRGAVLLGSLFLLATSNVVSAQSYITDKVVVGVYELPDSESTLLRALPTGTPLEIISKQGDYTQVRTPDELTGWIENSYIIEHKPAQLVVLELTDKQKLTENELADAHKQILDMQEKIASLQDASSKADSAELNKLKSSNRSLRNKLGELEQDLKKSQQNLKDSANDQKKLEKELAGLREAASKAKAEPAKEEVPVNHDEQPLQKLRSENAAMKKQLDAIYAALSITTPTSQPVDEDTNNIHISIGWFIIWVLAMLIAGVIFGWKWFDWMHVKRHGGFRL